MEPDFREVIRDTGIVVGVDVQSVQCMFLAGETYDGYQPAGMDQSKALDQYAIPETFAHLDDEIRWLENSKFPVPIKSIHISKIEGVDPGSVQIGSIVHRHVFHSFVGRIGVANVNTSTTAYCFGPAEKNPDETREYIESIRKGRIDELQKRTDEMRKSEELLRIKGECGVLVEPGEEIYPFADAKFTYDGNGRLVGAASRFALAGAHTTSQIVIAIAKCFNPTEVHSLEGDPVFFSLGSQYIVPHIFPMDEVDEIGVPVWREGSWLEIEVSTGSPFRYARDSEERKIRVSIGDRAFWAQPDGEMLLGNQSQAGEGVFLYNGFREVGAKSVLVKSVGDGEQKALQTVKQRLLLPANEDVLREIRLEFLGI